MGDGDGWVWCAQGHRHWGRLGAAGLFLVDRDRVVLQHRAARTHEGDTWGVPGGARDSHEDVVETALREAGEEAGIAAESVDPIGTASVDHGGWSYTTVVATARGEVRPHAANWESSEVRWWDAAEVGELVLHPGFALSWPALRRQVRPLTIVVDMANVVGSRPDGWWRDRAGATARLAEQITRLSRNGIAAADLPAGIDLGPIDRVLPRLVLVVEGAAAVVAPDLGVDDGGVDDGGVDVAAAAGASSAAAAPWWQARAALVAAPGSGDDQVVAEVQRVAGGAAAGGSGFGEGGTATVALAVTADRGLRARLPAGVHVAGPSWLTRLLT